MFDIDGTLTYADAEFDMQLADETYVPKMMGAADKLVQAWDAKHYPVIYLTARDRTPCAPRARGWLVGSRASPRGRSSRRSPSREA